MRNILFIILTLFTFYGFSQKLHQVNSGFHSVLFYNIKEFEAYVGHFETEGGYESQHELAEDYYPEMIRKFNKTRYYIHNISPSYTMKDSNSLVYYINILHDDLNSKEFNRDTLLLHTKALKEQAKKLSSDYQNLKITYFESIKIIRAHLLSTFLYKTYIELDILQQLIATLPKSSSIQKAVLTCKKNNTLENIILLLDTLNEAEKSLK